MRIAIIIPARYGSTRFPGKPLVKIAGKTMLARVVDLAKDVASTYENINVYITSDDARIADHAREIGAKCIMTDPQCPSGSDRALAAAKQLTEKPDFILNLQGDAPFTPKAALHAMIKTARSSQDAEVITPVHKLSWDDLDRLRESKKTTPYSGTCTILNADNKALWFSKNIIPAIRKEENLRAKSPYSPVHQHMGLYGYRRDILEKFCALPLGHYEQLEGLEQLRFLENGISITCVPIDVEAGTLQSGIDTPEDLDRAEKQLKSLENISK